MGNLRERVKHKLADLNIDFYFIRGIPKYGLAQESYQCRCTLHDEEFNLCPSEVFRGRSLCPVCTRHNAKTARTEKAKLKASLAHSGKFDYSGLPDAIHSRDKVTLSCPVHGDFTQVWQSHIAGHGCRLCGDEDKRTPLRSLSSNLSLANKKHNLKYGYSNIVKSPLYTDIVTIVCPLHGEFRQEWQVHLKGCGCKACGKELGITKNLKGADYYRRTCSAVHKNKYDYSLWGSEVRRHSKVRTICPEHGTFTQTVDSHMKGRGCKTCSRVVSKQELEMSDWVCEVYEGHVEPNYDLYGINVDLYLPDYSLALEWQGSYWHSARFKDKDHHMDRFLALKLKGIRLVSLQSFRGLDYYKDYLLDILHYKNPPPALLTSNDDGIIGQAGFIVLGYEPPRSFWVNYKEEFTPNFSCTNSEYYLSRNYHLVYDSGYSIWLKVT